MPRKRISSKKQIESYEHRDKQRLNNPPAGLVTSDTDPESEAQKTYSYDPHIDPQLQWAGKAEHTSFEVPTVSLHVHERIEARSIIESVRKRNGDGQHQKPLFAEADENPPLRKAVEFYKHPHGWSNRLVAGDSLLVMNSLLEKEGMAGKVQMVYIDPPYGIKYGSNFQPFVNKRDVKDGKDEDLTAEPEQIRAFRDTWELGIHSYLTYLRDRLLLVRELLTESGSVFVQINDDNLHHAKEILDETFGCRNFVNIIPFKKRASYLSRFGNGLFEQFDYIVWYGKDINVLKFRQLYKPKDKMSALQGEFRYYKDAGKIRTLSKTDILQENIDISQIYRTHSATKRSNNPQNTYPIDIDGTHLKPPAGHEWKEDYNKMLTLKKANRLIANNRTRPYKIYFADFPYSLMTNLWDDTLAEQFPVYAVQTDELPVQRCLLMTTDPGDLVFDPTCGSGTTAYVAEQWGRRWITCDTSRVALTLAKQRLMTSVFDYYELAHPQEGVGSGFKYKTVPHITLKSIANNPDIKEGMSRKQIDAAIARHADHETLYDQPLVDTKKRRVSGPFTVEAVPAPAVKSVDSVLEGLGDDTSQTAEPQTAAYEADTSIARSGETIRQGQWRDELLKTGIRAKGGDYIRFARLEPLPGLRWLHADGETRSEDNSDKAAKDQPQRIVVSFGPEHAPLEQRQVEQAIEDARTLVPQPKLIVFAAFQFDPEASKDIDETNWPGVMLLKAQMNADLLTDDLKKERATNDSFWLIGQPDVEVEHITEGEDKGKIKVSVGGFDYYDTRTGDVVSGDSSQIAVWMLDTDYDGRSITPNQVFFPMASKKEGWARLANSLKAEIDEDRIESFRGSESLPFSPGEHERIAVKIVDDRGIESLKVMEVE